MYVCSCNAFTDKAVRQAIEAGCKTPAQVYKHLGVKPQCAICAHTIKDMIDTATGAKTPDGACGADCTKCGGCKSIKF